MDQAELTRLRRGTYVALLVLGAFSQVAQALLGRELLVVFHGNEISLGAFYGAWLFWIAVGAFSVAWLRARGRIAEPLSLFRLFLLLMPVLLAAEVEGARNLRVIMDVPSVELVPLGRLLLATVAITLPVSLAVGFAFPLGCEVLARARVSRGAEAADMARDVSDVSHLYVLEAGGALGGGMLFTFLFVEWFGAWRTVGAAAVLLAIGVALLAGRSRRVLALAALAGVAGVAVCATPLGGWLNRRSEVSRFASMHPGLKLLDTVETRYGHVEVARFGQQISVAHDGRISDNFPDRIAVALDAAYFYSQADRPKRVLLFGGLASGLAAELLRYPIDHLEVVEQDRRAFDLIRPYLEPATRAALDDQRLELHFEDGRRFVNRAGEAKDYDLVLVLTPDPASAYLNRYFTRDFYQRVHALMSPGGVICTRVRSAANYMGSDVASYSGSIYRTLRDVFPHLVVVPGDVHIFCAAGQPGRVSSDPELLAGRYLNAKVRGRTIPASAFASLLPADRVAFVREKLEAEDAEPNTDLQPVTYYLNMILWGKYTSSELVEVLDALRRMGLWTWFVPLVIFVFLFVARMAMSTRERAHRRRTSASVAIALLGFVAMAAQMQLLLSYQAHVGFVFGRIALLNGVFMTGLALGAGLIGARLARISRPGLALGGVLALVSGACALLPAALASLSNVGASAQEPLYLVLVCGAGVLTGAGFPLGVELAHGDRRDVVRTSGGIEAADHLGGAAGGILAGAVLVPLLGVRGTSHMLAAAALVALAPVLFAELAPDPSRRAKPSLLTARGYASFPFTRLSFLLAFSVLSVFAVSTLARRAAEGPIVRFDDATLANVSGSEVFSYEGSPMPHYLGTSAATDERTVSLASMPVASDIKGYAGPLNLLVAVDDQGVLRGVRYVASNESPAYIEGIETWLTGLAGRDLSKEPLSLGDVDAISGATITSKAALETVNRAAAKGAHQALGVDFSWAHERQGKSLFDAIWHPRVVLGLLLLIAFFPVFYRGGDRSRLVYQLASIAILGFAFNSLFTEVDLVNLSLGRFPSFDSNAFWYFLLGFVVLTSLSLGQVYCGYVCPFGALQEVLSRVGRWFRLRTYAHSWAEMRMRYAKFVLASVALIAVWTSGDMVWVAFNPMQHVFDFRASGWLGWLLIASLVGALFYFRFWCRYLCPMGAVLAIGNKLALFRGGAPERRVGRCDLGARHRFDLDCLQCNRCVSGSETGVRSRGSTSSARRDPL